MKIRRLSTKDLADVARIQRECYSGHFIESVESFAAKLSAHADFSFVAESGGVAVGYVVAFPWTFGEVPELGGLDYTPAPDTDSLYLHDLAVIPAARRSGAADRLFDAVLGAARSAGLERIFLVAIGTASRYWRRHGFEVVEVDEMLERRLEGYGAGATYMARAVAT
ncbi:MAG TPA: GNAT family N-acetyltransferase [Thermomicrobiales bacterium]|nr:GNAT family N-acetyltransferase [Thermomicrobiales bacterium]